MPASLVALDEDHLRAQVIIKQGMYHQIKRMFLKYGMTVKELKRIKMGALELDSSLEEGDSRYLTQSELMRIESDRLL